jgi:hypothetical protein
MIRARGDQNTLRDREAFLVLARVPTWTQARAVRHRISSCAGDERAVRTEKKPPALIGDVRVRALEPNVSLFKGEFDITCKEVQIDPAKGRWSIAIEPTQPKVIETLLGVGHAQRAQHTSQRAC